MFYIIKNNAISIKSFGLGFIQIKLQDDISINVYLDDIFKFSNYESPHSHQRNFHSRILAGNLTEYLYDVIIVDNGSSAYCGCGDVEKEIDFQYRYKLKEMYSYDSGDSYIRNKDEFHSVSAINGTVTYIIKDMTEESDAIVISDKIHTGFNPNTNDEILWESVKPYLINLKI